jgi:hypothetical protein
MCLVMQLGTHNTAASIVRLLTTFDSPGRRAASLDHVRYFSLSYFSQHKAHTAHFAGSR